MTAKTEDRVANSSCKTWNENTAKSDTSPVNFQVLRCWSALEFEYFEFVQESVKCEVEDLRVDNEGLREYRNVSEEQIEWFEDQMIEKVSTLCIYISNSRLVAWKLAEWKLSPRCMKSRKWFGALARYLKLSFKLSNSRFVPQTLARWLKPSVTTSNSRLDAWKLAGPFKLSLPCDNINC